VAILWRDGAVYALDDLISVADSRKPYLHLEAGIDVNNRGQILTYGRDSRDGAEGGPRLFLLTPAQ